MYSTTVSPMSFTRSVSSVLLRGFAGVRGRVEVCNPVPPLISTSTFPAFALATVCTLYSILGILKPSAGTYDGVMHAQTELVWGKLTGRGFTMRDKGFLISRVKTHGGVYSVTADSYLIQ